MRNTSRLCALLLVLVALGGCDLQELEVMKRERTGGYHVKICVDGILYLVLHDGYGRAGASVAYDQDGRVKQCDTQGD